MMTIASASVSSRVSVRLHARSARVATARSTRAAVVRVSADAEESKGWKSVNVTKPNLVNNLDGTTTRNIDGKVYTV